MTNATIPLPRSPGRWITPARCGGCGATYRDHRCGTFVACGFGDGVATVRQANGGYREGGGFRSRSAVLHAMRAAKLADWFLTHEAQGCAARWAARQRLTTSIKRAKPSGRGVLRRPVIPF